MEENLLTVEEAAKRLSVTDIHLRKLINDGDIAFVNVAKGKSRRSIRIERSAIEKFINQGGVK